MEFDVYKCTHRTNEGVEAGYTFAWGQTKGEENRPTHFENTLRDLAIGIAGLALDSKPCLLGLERDKITTLEGGVIMINPNLITGPLTPEDISYFHSEYLLGIEKLKKEIQMKKVNDERARQRKLIRGEPIIYDVFFKQAT